jgi:hypothetical protein
VQHGTVVAPGPHPQDSVGKEATCVLTRQLNVVPTAKLLVTHQLAPLLLGSTSLAPFALLLLQQTLTMPSDVPTRSCRGLQDSKTYSHSAAVEDRQGFEARPAHKSDDIGVLLLMLLCQWVQSELLLPRESRLSPVMLHVQGVPGHYIPDSSL